MSVRKVRLLSFLLLFCLLLGMLPSAHASNEPFEPVYTARITVRSSLRTEPDENSRRVATLYKGDAVELDEIGEVWTLAQRAGNVGYVLTASLRNVEVLSPYHGLPEGEEFFPYAATALAPAKITGAIHGSLGEELQTIPKDAVIAVGMPDEDGGLLLPYMRTVGRADSKQFRLEPVVHIDDALPGDLIAVYATFFAADIERSLMAGRLHNIQKGVELFDGVVVLAGEQFSFNAIAAPYTKANGYERGPIINYTSDKKSGFGGGICQVTTTLYNALLQLNVHIVRWAPHSSRGIEYAPVGFDAAVGTGNLDFIFENDLPYPVRMALNVWDGVVTVRLYCAADDDV
ncbi:MAG: VanW family protein [Clostridia bacterium]|nr:VanW family protein [Clostridia bacterium]